MIEYIIKNIFETPLSDIEMICSTIFWISVLICMCVMRYMKYSFGSWSMEDKNGFEIQKLQIRVKALENERIKERE